MNTNDSREMPLRILVVVASYGSANDRYLDRLLAEYKSMSFDTDIIVLSNIEKKLLPGIECQVGLPTKNPWSLPFAHKDLFAKHADSYDLFVYSEDDILITEKNIRALIDVTAVLRDDEVAGFLRIEKSGNGEESYPDVHGCFHWDPRSTRSRGGYTLGYFTNEHAACYVLSRAQLKKAIASGGFLVEPHQEKYDLLCTAATDPYTQCGLTKLIPVSDLANFTVHHMSNKYAGKVGILDLEMKRQVEELTRLYLDRKDLTPLFNTETKLPLASYSKDYYEPVAPEIVSAVPLTARKVLSIGCGWGATERLLVDRGVRVVAIPLDPVVSASAAIHGIEMIDGGLDGLTETDDDEPFDCVLCLNVLHLVREPVQLLSRLQNFLSTDSSIIIQSPNMISLRAIRSMLRDYASVPFGKDYETTGAHFSSIRTMRNWCAASGLMIDRIERTVDRSQEKPFGSSREAIASYLSGSFILSLAPSIVVSARRVST